jgi:hypothetical protein
MSNVWSFINSSDTFTVCCKIPGRPLHNLVVLAMHESLVKVINNLNAISKPQRKFLITIINAFMVYVGKANYRNLSRYCSISEKTISRWFSKGLSLAQINVSILSILPQAHDKIGVIDASFIKKSGRHTQGLSMFWSGADGASKKGLEMSLISIVDIECNTAYALDARQTIDTEDKSRTELYADHIDSLVNGLKSLKITHIAADAFYTKRTFIDRLCNNGFHMVGKLRCDANLQWVYRGIQSGVGRPKLYDGKVSFVDLDRFGSPIAIDDGIEMYNAIVHSPSMRRKINVVMLLNQDTQSYALLFSTDLSLDAIKIVKYYRARFQIEFVIRDAKQHMGLEDCQARNSKAINSHLNLSLLALNAIKIEDALHKNAFSKSVISMASWKRIKFNERYIEWLFYKLKIQKDDEKYHELFDDLRTYGVIAA